MIDKISLLKESGELLNSNIVSVFMIPETGKEYIITSENGVDPHGLIILHVSEIINGESLARVATDEEWMSIKAVMRSIISGSVGSYQYLTPLPKASVKLQYSRDISVSLSASKQMIDNYFNSLKASEAESSGGSIFPNDNGSLTAENEVVPGIAEVDASVAGTQEVQSVVEPTNIVPDVSNMAQPVVNIENSVSEIVPVISNENVVPEVTPVVNIENVVPEVAPVVDAEISQIDATINNGNNSVVIENVVIDEQASNAELQANVDMIPAIEKTSDVETPPIVLTGLDEQSILSEPGNVENVVNNLESNESDLGGLEVQSNAQENLEASVSIQAVPEAQIVQADVTTDDITTDSSCDDLNKIVNEFVNKVIEIVGTTGNSTKEEELKAWEEKLNAREKAITDKEKAFADKMAAVMSNFSSLQ